MQTPPQEINYLRADSLLQQIQDSIFVPLEAHSIQHYYNYATRLKNQKALAIDAQNLLEKGLESLQDSSHCAYYWSKLALALHFQIEDYAYNSKLPQLYHQSMDWINKAIQFKKQSGLSEHLAALHLTAAQLAMPHFYYALQSNTSAEAEALAYSYMNKAADLYLELGKAMTALAVQRSLKKQGIDDLIKRIELGIEVEGENSLAVANDILYLHQITENKTVSSAERETIRDYGTMALHSYALQPNEKRLQRQALMRAIAYHFRRQEIPATSKALDLLLECQVLELEDGKDLYYNAFAIAAIYIEQGNYDKAMKQYHLALSDEHLSHTDTEYAHLGLAICHQLKNEAKNVGYYMQQIVDDMALNGISSFPSNFLEDFRPQLKKVALEIAENSAKKNTLEIIKAWR